MAQEFAKAFYHSRQWIMARKQALSRDHYTCQLCDGRAEEIHHIIPLTPANITDYNISLNINNLQSLCHNCHNKITKGYTGDIVEGYCFDDNGDVVKC